MQNESVLLSKARRMDQNALAEIYNLLSPGLYRYAMRQLGDVDLAEECVAETFSRLLNAIHRGGGPRKHLQAYLYRVAHNWITDQYRGKSTAPFPLDNGVHIDPKSGPAKATQEQMEQQEVRAALFHLTPDQRQVIVLKYLEGWKNKDIAETLGKSVGAVKALQNRALTALKRHLVEDQI